MNLNIIKLFLIILIGCILCILYVNNNNNKNNNNNNINNIDFFTPSATSFQTPIINELKSSYNKMNKNRFKTIDNQIRLDNISKRINKLFDNMQITYNMTNQKTNSITFY